MLQNLRDRVHGLIAGVLFTLLAISFAFWGISYYLGGGDRAGKVIATVGGQNIHQPQLDSIWRRAQQQGQVSLNMPAAMQQQLRQTLLQQLIDRAAQVDAAKRLGLYLGDNYLRLAIATMPEFQSNGQFSRQRFMSLLQANQMTEQSFLSFISKQLLMEQAVNGLLATDFVLPHTVSRSYSLLNQQRFIRYLTISPKQFTSKHSWDDAELKKYYQQNQNLFILPAQVKVNYVQLTPNMVKAKVSVTPQQVKLYYDNNRTLFVRAARWKLVKFTLSVADDASQQAKQEVLKQARDLRMSVLLGRSTFSAIANKYSGTSVPRWYMASELPPQSISAVKSLTSNSMSAPVAVKGGYTVYKLLSYQKSQQQPLAAIQDKIKRQLQQGKVNDLLQQQSSRLSDLAYTNPDSLQPAAKALGLSIKHSSWFSRHKTPKGVLSEPKVVAAVFSKDVLQQGNNSNTISLADGSLLVVRVAANKSSRLQPLSVVRSQVIEGLRNQEAQAKAEQFSKKVEQDLDDGKPVQKILAKYGIAWKKPKLPLLPQSTNPSPSVVAAAFELSTGKGSVSTTQSANGDFTVLQLLQIKDADKAKLTSMEKSTLKAKLQGMQQQLNHKLYLQAALEQSVVKVFNFN